MPFTLKNLRKDREDVGSNFEGAPDLEFRLAAEALDLEILVFGAPNLGDDPRGDVEDRRDWWAD